MSCQIVEHSLIDALVTYARKNLRHLAIVDRQSPEALGQMLIDENQKAYNIRYPQDAENPTPYRFREYIGPMHSAQIINAATYLDYQCSEHDDYETSATWRFLMELTQHAASDLARAQGAKWGMPPNPARGGRGPVLLSALSARN